LFVLSLGNPQYLQSYSLLRIKNDIIDIPTNDTGQYEEVEQDKTNQIIAVSRRRHDALI
jgi:hypothetical protein